MFEFSPWDFCFQYAQFFIKILFICQRERERERTSRGSCSQREKQTPCWARSPMRDLIPGPGDHDLSRCGTRSQDPNGLSRRQTLNRLSHPHVPAWQSFSKVSAVEWKQNIWTIVWKLLYQGAGFGLTQHARTSELDPKAGLYLAPLQIWRYVLVCESAKEGGNSKKREKRSLFRPSKQPVGLGSEWGRRSGSGGGFRSRKGPRGLPVPPGQESAPHWRAREGGRAGDRKRTKLQGRALARAVSGTHSHTRARAPRPLTQSTKPRPKIKGIFVRPHYPPVRQITYKHHHFHKIKINRWSRQANFFTGTKIETFLLLVLINGGSLSFVSNVRQNLLIYKVLSKSWTSLNDKVKGKGFANIISSLEKCFWHFESSNRLLF